MWWVCTWTRPSGRWFFVWTRSPRSQALEGSQRSLPLKPGRVGTMTHDYKRILVSYTGTTSITVRASETSSIIGSGSVYPVILRPSTAAFTRCWYAPRTS